jgi:hypothetical protein
LPQEPASPPPASPPPVSPSSPAPQPGKEQYVAPPERAPQAPPPQAAARTNGIVYDFVCEDDVKRAIAAREKIYINSKTIITPSARELGEEREVFARL